jgi:hypothetical protein
MGFAEVDVTRIEQAIISGSVSTLKIVPARRADE